MSEQPETELFGLQAQFYDRAKMLYPNVVWPQMVWLFDMVLEIDPRTVAVEAITKKKYTHIDRVAQRNVTRKFDPRQRQALREWWPLIPDYMKVA